MIYYYTNGKLAWLKIAKNACSSWSSLFDGLGWQYEDLYSPSVPLSDLKFFGFLRDPDVRHNMGVAQYIKSEKLQSLLEDSQYQRLCASACFDEHSYSIHSQIPSDVIDSTEWFVMDHEHFDYETLVRNFLRSHSVDLPPVPRLNRSSDHLKLIQKRVGELKTQYPDQHAKLAKNFLGADLKLYRTKIKEQHIWDQ
jgi:hypothetical protein